MALKYTKETVQKSAGKLALGGYLAENAELKDYLRQMLAEYEPSLVPLKELRRQLAQQLKGRSLSELVRQIREESEH